MYTGYVKKNMTIGKVETSLDSSVREISEVYKYPDDLTFVTSELDCSEDFREEVTDLLIKNKNLFSKTDSDLGQTNNVTMKIDTRDHAPIKLRPYRVPLKN